ncbi:MAG TPA: hypothetical protein VGJ71_04435 [Candidatus Limnocylindrales bacterium]
MGDGAPRIRRAAATALVATLALAACGSGPGGGTPRPTDPREILVQAIHATAVVKTLHLHADIGMTMGGFGNGLDRMTASMDADVDLVTRQFAGRSTSQMPGALGNAQIPARQTSDVIVTRTATFSRNGDTGRWTKMPGGGIPEQPTNTEIATMIANLLSNPAVTFEKADSGSCSLGTCDHVIAHIDGQTLGAALAPLVGMPLDDATSAMIPNFDVDVLVDQATSVISEIRTGYSAQGTTLQVLLQLSSLGEPVQINEPPAALVDDFSGFGPDGVGSDFLTPEPITVPADGEPAPSTP